MLVITRKIGESFIIGGNIEVSITDIQGDKVRVAIQAPRSISILRKELVEEVKKENMKATDSGDISLDALQNFLKNNK